MRTRSKLKKAVRAVLNEAAKKSKELDTKALISSIENFTQQLRSLPGVDVEGTAADSLVKKMLAANPSIAKLRVKVMAYATMEAVSMALQDWVGELGVHDLEHLSDITHQLRMGHNVLTAFMQGQLGTQLAQKEKYEDHQDKFVSKAAYEEYIGERMLSSLNAKIVEAKATRIHKHLKTMLYEHGDNLMINKLKTICHQGQKELLEKHPKLQKIIQNKGADADIETLRSHKGHVGHYYTLEFMSRTLDNTDLPAKERLNNVHQVLEEAHRQQTTTITRPTLWKRILNKLRELFTLDNALQARQKFSNALFHETPLVVHARHAPPELLERRYSIQSWSELQGTLEPEISLAAASTVMPTSLPMENNESEFGASESEAAPEKDALTIPPTFGDVVH